MSPRHRRAIILDDDSGVRHLLETIVSRCGYTVVTYASPAEATLFSHPEQCPLATGHEELFEESPTCAELIIADIDMPCINGIEYMRKICEVGCNVQRRALISGNWTEHQKLEAAALGCRMFTKPFNIAEMKDWVLDSSDAEG